MSLSLLIQFVHYEKMRALKIDSSVREFFTNYLTAEILKRDGNMLKAHFARFVPSQNWDQINALAGALKTHIIPLLDSVTKASELERINLQNYILLAEDIGDAETDCRLWNDLREAKKMLPNELAATLLEKARSL